MAPEEIRAGHLPKGGSGPAVPRAGNRGRSSPSLFQYDFLVLKLLHDDIAHALAATSPSPRNGGLALDVGAGGAPYRVLLESAGYQVCCLDIAEADGVDVVGSAERTGLPSRSVDLILCTQVLEHARAPWLAMREFDRILRPGGAVLISVPHVWFFHPHPCDYWRMTAQGLRALCDEGNLGVVELRSQGGSAAALFQVLNFLAFGVLGRAGAPLYAVMNALGLLLNGVVKDARFALNHSCLARKSAVTGDAAESRRATDAV